ncbi:MAG: hypothetical protein RIG62_29855 [Cyclobacteriaceae bacterium]
MSATIKQKFADARIAITNTLASEDIQKRLNGFGFNQRRMQDGNGLLDQVTQLTALQEDKYGAYYDSTDAFYQELEQIKERHRRHRKVALIAYEGNRSMALKLRLKGETKKITDTIDRISTFYDTLAKDSSGIAAYGITPEEIAQTRAMIQSMIDLRSQQIARKGEAQHATQQRDQALRQLNNWMKDFRYAARFALRDEPQLLEVVGIKVPS